MGMMPRTREFKVVGIFSLGLYEFDSGYGFVDLDVAEVAARQGRSRTSSSCGSTTCSRRRRSPTHIPEQLGVRLRRRRTGPT